MVEVFETLGVTLLQCSSCIRYPVKFKENPEIQALIDSGNEVNVMTPTYVASLGLSIWETNIQAQKIDGLTLVIYGLVIARFSIQDKWKGPIFWKIFLVSDISIEVILEILFFSFNNVNIRFAETSDLT